jgi:cytochrome P450/NADPH-cytochrome P450 reductase
MKLKPLPQPRAYPVLGNLLDLDVNTPIQTMMKLKDEYGPAFRLKVPTEDLVVISSAELCHEVCDESRFDKKVHGPLDVVRDYAGDGLITAHTREPNWAKAHRILLPAFGGGSLRPMFEPMLDVAEQMVLKWERLGARHPIDVSDDMTRLTVDTISLCGFGYRLNSFYDRTMHPFVDAMMRSLTESSARTRRPPFLSNFLLRKRHRYAADTALMHGLADEIIAARKAQRTDGQDVLSTMLNAADPVTGEKLDDTNIRHQMVTFLIAGHETTSGLLSFALYELLRNPAAMEAARAEVDAVLGRGRPAFDDLPKLRYLDQVLKETLRLWPTAPAFAVFSKAPETSLGGRWHVHAKQTILLLLPAIGRDPAAWEAPEAFLPERMEATKFRNLPPGAWKPFGNGQRSCIGRAFALQEATLALALVLQRFDLRHVEEGKPLRIRESLTLKPDGFRVYAEPRRARSGRRANPRREEGPAVSAGPLHILFGSKTGTAEAFARELAEDAVAHGFAPTVASLDDYAARPLAPRTVLLTASYDGRPPENAKAFAQALAHAAAGAHAGVGYAVFGCGNRDWARTYQAIPKLFDRRLSELGATRLFDRGEADARGDSRADFLNWKEGLFAALKPRAFRVEVLPAEDETAAVAVVDEPVRRALQRFGLRENARLRLSGGGAPEEVRPAAEVFAALDLSRPAPRAAVEAVLAAVRCPPERAPLAAFLAKEATPATEAPSLLTLLEGAPSAEIPLSDFLAYLK